MVEFTNEVDLDAELVEEIKMEDVVTVTGCSMLNIRALPSLNAQVRGIVGKDEELKVLSRNGDWVRVTASDGVVGYVKSDFVSD